MPVAETFYGTPTALTWTLTAPASDINGLIGRQSSVVTNTVVLAIDYMVGGSFTLSATTPTAGAIEVWVSGSYDNGTTFPGGMAAAGDAAVTTTSPKKSQLRMLTVIPTAATISEVLAWGPCSIAEAFGGVVPTHWTLWMTQRTGQLLAAGSASYTPIEFTST